MSEGEYRGGVRAGGGQELQEEGVVSMGGLRVCWEQVRRQSE